MEGISEITNTVRIPVTIPVRPYMMDHCFRGRAVLAAVEAMEGLAGSVKEIGPEVEISHLTRARFDKLLYLPLGGGPVDAFHDISFCKNKDVIATLRTKSKSPGAGISRIKEHACVCFSPGPAELPMPPSGGLTRPGTDVLDIPAARIYAQLVPFGPAYQNLVNVLHLSEQCAAGTVQAPELIGRDNRSGLLGSPFPLDAALHAACAWGCQFAGFTTFPVAFDSRVLWKKTRPGELYITRVVPVKTSSDPLVFNIWIFDRGDNPVESVSGARMKKVGSLPETGFCRQRPW